MQRPNKLLLIVAFTCSALISASAKPEGIFNPAATFVGDLQGIDSNAATGGGGIVGALLLEDGTSIILLEDGTSNLCLEGGC